MSPAARPRAAGIPLPASRQRDSPLCGFPRSTNGAGSAPARPGIRIVSSRTTCKRGRCWRVRSVRGHGRGVSTWYGGRGGGVVCDLSARDDCTEDEVGALAVEARVRRLAHHHTDLPPARCRVVLADKRHARPSVPPGLHVDVQWRHDAGACAAQHSTAQRASQTAGAAATGCMLQRRVLPWSDPRCSVRGAASYLLAPPCCTPPQAPARGTRRVRLVRGEGRGVSN
jgi:hypothetical protein